MIKSLNLIRNVGPFNLTAGANLPFKKLTVLYAENGRGKTMLSVIFDSLANDDQLLISERRRLGSANPPHIAIVVDDGTLDRVFQNNSWNTTYRDLAIFNDNFVNQNVYSGLKVEAGHRQNLHELILGSQGIALNNQLQSYVNAINVHNKNLEVKSILIPFREYRISVDQFCELANDPNIDTGIIESERMLLSFIERTKVRDTAILPALVLPDINVTQIEHVLQSDISSLDNIAEERVRNHITEIGDGGERWIDEGMRRISTIDNCPFCDQTLEASTIIDHYRAFFGEEYTSLKEEIAEIKTSYEILHNDNAATTFVQSISQVREGLAFWAKFCDVPEMNIDPETIIQDWSLARNHIESALETKRSSPLEMSKLSEDARNSIARFKCHIRNIKSLNYKLNKTNEIIDTIKNRPAAGELQTLKDTVTKRKAVKARHSPEIAPLCNDYIEEKNAKADTEQLRRNARTALNNYQANIFRDYEVAVNRYLNLFNAGFQLDSIQSHGISSGSGSTCNYDVIIIIAPFQLQEAVRYPVSLHLEIL